MRIVAGEQRGRRLVAPKGHSTRPTADRVRQALYNVLEHGSWGRGLAGVRVLDLFAGSGALGLEALSRGAAYCLFVDQDRAARAAIERNLDDLGVSSRAKLLTADASRLGRTLEAPFDLAFLDPPYGDALTEAALVGLASGGWLAPDALIVAERGADETPLRVDGFGVLDARLWGAARVWFLRAI